MIGGSPDFNVLNAPKTQPRHNPALISKAVKQFTVDEVRQRHISQCLWVRAWVSNYIPLKTMDVINHSCLKSMLNPISNTLTMPSLIYTESHHCGMSPQLPWVLSFMQTPLCTLQTTWVHISVCTYGGRENKPAAWCGRLGEDMREQLGGQTWGSCRTGGIYGDLVQA